MQNKMTNMGDSIVLNMNWMLLEQPARIIIPLAANMFAIINCKVPNPHGIPKLKLRFESINSDLIENTVDGRNPAPPWMVET